jgi:hypothetical protein
VRRAKVELKFYQKAAKAQTLERSNPRFCLLGLSQIVESLRLIEVTLSEKRAMVRTAAYSSYLAIP